MKLLDWTINKNKDNSPKPAPVLNLMPEAVPERVLKFHSQVSGYETGSLKSLKNLSCMLGLGGIWVKDESKRFDLNSFKVLGGSYAIYMHLKERLGIKEDIDFKDLTSSEVKSKLGTITFATATDGNHGRGVAWSAEKLGHSSVVYVPRGTSSWRIKAIENYGASVEVINGTYDDAVESVKQDASRNGWQVISDTAWEGYEEIPRWVIQGYTTMFSEAQRQFSGSGTEYPTHVLVQAGVGSLAASVVAFYKGLLGDKAPVFIVIEPDKAACIYESARIGDGNPHLFEGDLNTIMAGLSCGVPNPLSWEVLSSCADIFISCPDYMAARGMRIYAVPLKNDPAVVSGESGAVTLGVLSFIMQCPSLSDLRETAGLGKKSQVLLINTEGDTDPDVYRRVVWNGAYPVPECDCKI